MKNNFLRPFLFVFRSVLMGDAAAFASMTTIEPEIQTMFVIRCCNMVKIMRIYWYFFRLDLLQFTVSKAISVRFCIIEGEKFSLSENAALIKRFSKNFDGISADQNVIWSSLLNARAKMTLVWKD